MVKKQQDAGKELARAERAAKDAREILDALQQAEKEIAGRGKKAK